MKHDNKIAPSEVRQRILKEHRHLRHLLVELQELARATTLESEHASRLRSSLRTLLAEFSLHLDSEEEILVPVIEKIDAWGAARADNLRKEHAEQRGMLRSMFRRAEDPRDACDLAEEVDRLVLRIFRDMREEEAELLHENVMRDDVIAIDQCSG